ncbi:hypothetical protein Pan54_13200 [Rubinisphaera italica]|uniref:Uncharacterized protein n=1 Tax=Rubinisphaera italica TaxID=2527969 RepID=A0A5C5XC48_9PLAN|nr:hypothetical protein [Rubinisphaera italica]TWT60606.1 hypothetical protein Pan54_13200 [Rubinisphaera italica]
MARPDVHRCCFTRSMPDVLIHKLTNQMIQVLFPKRDKLVQARVFNRLNKAFAAAIVIGARFGQRIRLDPFIDQLRGELFRKLCTHIVQHDIGFEAR